MAVLTFKQTVPKAQENAVARLKRRIAERLDADKDRPRGFRRTQQGLAARIGIGKATFNELLNGPASTRGLLAHLDKIAEYFGVPPSLLIHRNDTALMEITPDEYRVLTHWRTFPPDVQDQLAAMFDYFAGFLPEEKEERRIWQTWRRLSPDRRAQMDRILADTWKAQQIETRATRGSSAAPGHTAETLLKGRLPRLVKRSAGKRDVDE